MAMSNMIIPAICEWTYKTQIWCNANRTYWSNIECKCI